MATFCLFLQCPVAYVLKELFLQQITVTLRRCRSSQYDPEDNNDANFAAGSAYSEFMTVP